MPSIKHHESKNLEQVGGRVLLFLLVFHYRRVPTKGCGKAGTEITTQRELLRARVAHVMAPCSTYMQ